MNGRKTTQRCENSRCSPNNLIIAYFTVDGIHDMHPIRRMQRSAPGSHSTAIVLFGALVEMSWHFSGDSLLGPWRCLFSGTILISFSAEKKKGPQEVLRHRWKGQVIFRPGTASNKPWTAHIRTRLHMMWDGIWKSGMSPKTCQKRWCLAAVRVFGIGSATGSKHVARNPVESSCSGHALGLLQVIWSIFTEEHPQLEESMEGYGGTRFYFCWNPQANPRCCTWSLLGYSESVSLGFLWRVRELAED